MTSNDRDELKMFILTVERSEAKLLAILRRRARMDQTTKQMHN